MKVLVGVKRVVDFRAQVRIKSDQSGVDTATVKMSMNPFDEIAVEEAVRLKEKGIATEIIVISIGSDAVNETIRGALALGADRGILIKTAQEMQPLSVAKILQHLVKQETPDLVILGKQAIDTDDNQVGQMLAGLLDWPQGTFASKIEIQGSSINVTREIDGGLETLSMTLPAVITTDLRLNEPRYLSLPNIVKAKTKPIVVIAETDLNLDLKPHFNICSVSAPEKKRSGVKVADVRALVAHLKNDAQVI